MQVTWFRNVATAVVFVAALVSGCTSDSTPTATDSIELTPDTQTIGVGAKQAFKAEVVKDGNRVDVTSDASWTSSDESVATVDSSGTATGVAKGTATITAKLTSGATASATLTVTDATLKELSLSPAKKSIAIGTTQDYALTGTYTDGSSHDVSNSTGITWSSSSESVATVSNKGVATGVSAGTTTISAKLQGITGSTTLTITGNALTALAIDPSPVSLANGTSQTLKVTASYSDGSSQEVTGDADWSTDDSDIASVSNDGDGKGTLSAKKSGTTNVKAAFMGMTASAAVVVTDASLKSLAITPATPSVAKGEQVDLVVMGTFSDNSKQDLTSTVTWTSSDTSVATVSNAAGSKGRVSALKTGTSKITASRNNINAHADVTVTDAHLVSIAISADSVTLPNGVSLQLTATGNYSDGTSHEITSDVTWSSSNSDVVSVDDSAEHKGEATGNSVGSATITATSNTITGTKELTVSSAVLTAITLSPLSPSIAKGTKVSFLASGTMSDGTSQDVTSAADWHSSNAATATFSATAGQHNQATGRAAGSSMITASLNGITSQAATLTVTDAELVSIAVSPATPTIAKGTTQQFVATGTYSDNTTQTITADVMWSSSANTVTIANSAGHEGLATGVDTGSVQVRASFGDIQSPQVTLVVTAATLVSIAVTPGAPSVAKGNTQQFTANGTYTDNSHQNLTSSVTWTSTNMSVATIGADGIATGVTQGMSTIRAAMSGKTSNNATLTVSAAQLMSVQITPVTASIANGTTQQYHATGIYSDSSHPDITSQVMWASSDTSVADVSALGLATAAATGTTNITATFNTVTSNTAALTVTNAVLQQVTITPGSATIHLGQARQFYASGLFSDNNSQDLTSAVTWASDDSSVVVSNTNSLNDPRGNATGVHMGSANITASYNGVTSQAVVAMVDQPVMTSIQIMPGNGSLAKGLTRNYQAQGYYSDSTNNDVTSSVTWTSSDPNVATITSNGHVDTLNTGTTTITASDSASQTQASVTLSVTSATVESIQVTPVDFIQGKIAQLTKEQYRATGFYTDNTTQDLTSAVLWASDNLNALTISNASGTSGIATAGMTAGDVLVNISATYLSVTGGTTVTVTAATLASIDVETDAPVDQITSVPTRPKGLTAKFTATGHFSDMTVQDLTTQVTWSSDTPTAATVSNAVGSEGIVSTVLAANGIEISASLQGVTGSATLNVSSAEVTNITITGGPQNGQMAKGTTTSYVATGTFTDGSHSNVTDSLTWFSDTPSIADLCGVQVAGSKCFLGVGVGTVNITARIVTSTATVDQTKVLTITPADLVSIAVTAPNSSTPLPAGLTNAYTATGTYTDGSHANITSNVIWSVDVPATADVSNIAPSKGLVTAKVVGTTNVIATQGTIHGQLALSVSAALLDSIDIDAPPASLPKGQKHVFHAYGTYSDGTQTEISDSVTWDTSNHSLATISNSLGHYGETTAVNLGTVTVTATKGTVVGTVDLVVSNAVLTSIQISAAQSSIALGTSEPFQAIGTYSDATTNDITTAVDWASSDDNTATVTLHGGLAQSVAVGPATITASQGGITSQNFALTIRNADLTQIQLGIEGGANSIPNGTSVHFSARGVYTDGHTQDITSQVNWSSSAPLIASVSNASNSEGLVTGHMVGTGVIITATAGTVFQDSSAFAITNAVVQSLTLTPNTPSIAKGTTKQFTVVANYSDGTTPTVTAGTTWSTSDGTVALVSNTAPSKGLASSVNMGTTTITAAFGGQTAMTTLTVTDATLQTITVTPANPSTPLGFTKQFTATGTYSDQSTQDLTNAVTWSSSNNVAAIISNGTGTKGLASTNSSTSGMNTTTIKATLGAKFGQTVFTVTNATLTSIEVLPADSTFGSCGCVTVTATGHFSDASTSDITSAVTFTSDDTTVVNVANNGVGNATLMQICPKATTGVVNVIATDPVSGIIGSTTAANNTVCP